MAHRCPSPGCEERVPSGRYACRRHWFTIPKPLRDELWQAFRTEGIFSEEYIAAAAACKEFLKETHADPDPEQAPA